MKSLFKKDTTSRGSKTNLLLQLRFLLPLLTAVIIALYIIVIRPHLMITMKTVPIELGFALILILSLVVAIATLFISILIAVIIAVCTRKKARITPWLLKLRSQLIVAVVLLFVNVVSILCSQWMAYTPPILGDNGKPLVGSIATLEKVSLGGSDQWITIRGKNKNNPVLLFLAGGPGGTQLAATREQLKKLEDNYVVVNWDQPGAGKSINAVPLKSITPERYISDGHELTQYLCNRFKQEKVYVLGESWGSALGILLVQCYPELFSAFIGTGQMVEFVETDVRMYELVLKMAKDSRDIKQIEKMKNQGLPPYHGKDVVWKFSTLSQYLSKHMTKNSEIERAGYNTFGEIGGTEYGLCDKVNYFFGLVTTFNHVYPQLYNLDLRKQAIKLDVPVYFMEGRHDVNASPVLVEDYFNSLKAPSKELIWFEHSGHDPWRNEPDKFVDLMINLILKETKIK
ncbi:alpha/beta hydrolase [Clostridium sp. CM027]|uniref:alpha/beta fold hydrolase n=1 Tax=Clostridium sp. CM027 TaxID=2849865 RepID=UPI001C6E1DCE|nr:alpha/beta hydrolase [Clostridium sp. CM027]MBW9146723.1 alpha/beta hydrolase [Clostridium sp. CM027]UVE41618.1 alpha/beta hydrolase [Clostridium sp. CM027]